MNIIIDLTLIAIIAYCAWRGYNKGILVGVCGLLAIIIAICIANLTAKVYSGEFTGILNPFANGIVDGAIVKVTGVDSDSEDDEEPIINLDGEEADVYSVSFAALRQLGLTESAAKDIAEETAKEETIVGQTMSEKLTTILCARAAFVIVFAIIFIIVISIFIVIGNVLNLYLAIPGAEKVNKYVGVGVGAVRGIIIVLFITCISRYLGLFVSEKLIESTTLFSWLIDANILANIIGI